MTLPGYGTPPAAKLISGGRPVKSPRRCSAVGTLPDRVTPCRFTNPSAYPKKNSLLRTTGPPSVPPN